MQREILHSFKSFSRETFVRHKQTDIPSVTLYLVVTGSVLGTAKTHSCTGGSLGLLIDDCLSVVLTAKLITICLKNGDTVKRVLSGGCMLNAGLIVE